MEGRYWPNPPELTVPVPGPGTVLVLINDSECYAYVCIARDDFDRAPDRAITAALAVLDASLKEGPPDD